MRHSSGPDEHGNHSITTSPRLKHPAVFRQPKDRTLELGDCITNGRLIDKLNYIVPYASSVTTLNMQQIFLVRWRGPKMSRGSGKLSPLPPS